MITTAKHADFLVARLDVSSFDAFNAGELTAELLKLAQQHTHVELDMAKTTFIDSAGVHALLSCSRTLRGRQGGLRLTGVSPRIGALLDLLHVRGVVAF